MTESATDKTRLDAKARALAFYLPQFHPIPENNDWWGAGFTEWTNVKRAKPLFDGHVQPQEPGSLGFYSLLDGDIREEQGRIATEAGVEGFVYWHYWFAGRRLLERPFNEVLAEKKPDHGFCLAWANHSWTASWVGRPWQMLLEQTYPGEEDYRRHFDELMHAFSDPRYITVDGAPLFVIFRPQRIPDCRKVMDLFRRFADDAGLPGIHLLGILGTNHTAEQFGLDGSIEQGIGELINGMGESFLKRNHWRHLVSSKVLSRKGLSKVHQALARMPRRSLGPLNAAQDLASDATLMPLRYPYPKLIDEQIRRPTLAENRYPCVLPNWDNTPRLGRWGTVLTNSNPQDYGRALEDAVARVQGREASKRFVFLKSWNEWAEGNYLEPDARFGDAYLRQTARSLGLEST